MLELIPLPGARRSVAFSRVTLIGLEVDYVILKSAPFFKNGVGFGILFFVSLQILIFHSHEPG